MTYERTQLLKKGRELERMAENKKPISKKQQACVNRYMASHYDRINLTVPKGKREIIQKHAEERGESATAFINRAIDEAIERDNSNK